MLPSSTSCAFLCASWSLGWKSANTPRRVSIVSRVVRSGAYLPTQWKVSPFARSMPAMSTPSAAISSTWLLREVLTDHRDDRDVLREVRRRARDERRRAAEQVLVRPERDHRCRRARRSRRRAGSGGRCAGAWIPLWYHSWVVAINSDDPIGAAQGGDGRRRLPDRGGALREALGLPGRVRGREGRGRGCPARCATRSSSATRPRSSRRSPC